MKDLLISIRLAALSLVACCVAYPLAVLGFAKAVAPALSEGSLVRDAQGTIVGSRLIAQKFERPGYFRPRPSAVDYNAAGAGGSNLSPTNPKLAERAKETIAGLELADGTQVPPDLVAASGSGLDPHITLASARLQAPRVAKARGVEVERIDRLVLEQAEPIVPAAFGGEPLVNVLELNLALDRP